MENVLVLPQVLLLHQVVVLLVEKLERCQEPVAGPIGIVAGAAVGTVAGAIAGALAGGIVGATAGAVTGRAIDEHILNNYACLKCGYKFNEA